MADMKLFIQEFLAPGDYVAAHTSGSTGTPKEILLSKRDMRTSARATNRFFGIGPKSLLVCPLSPDYIAGKMMAVRALEAGCRLETIPPSNKLDIPAEWGLVDLLPVVPTQIDYLLEKPSILANVKNLLIGGAAPTDRQCAALVAAGVKAWISYGMTETCSHVALADASAPRRVYRAMPGVEFRLSARGTLTVVAPDYSFGELETNDEVELLGPAAFRWLGRSDNTVNSGGLKIHPEALETEFAALLPGVPFYLHGIKDEKWGTSLAMTVEGDPSLQKKISEILSARVADRRHIPKKFFFTDSLPRTSNGKLKRQKPGNPPED